jgi:TonB family protein
MWRSISLLVILLLLVLTPARAQIEQGPLLSSRRTEKPDIRGSETVIADPASTLYLARSLANKILSLRDIRAKSIGVARMADVVWSNDEPYARSLFEKALSATSNQQDNSADIKLLPGLRRRVIVILARRDSEWAKRLIDAAAQTGDSEQDSKTRSAMNLSAAKSLIEADPDLAVKFAERSLRESMTPAFLEFELNLRKTDKAAANALFLQALAHLGQEPTPSIGPLHTLGVYLFTAPNLLDSDAYAVTRVGDIMVPNIAVQRPEAPPFLVREYLRTAGMVLWRTASDPNQKQASYALAYLLRPKAQSVAPDLAGPIEAAMSAMVAGVPPSIAQESAYKYINAVPANADERLDKAEEKPDQESREVAYLDLAHWAWRKGDFKTARIANGRIENRELSRKVEVLVNFGEAVWSIKHDSKRVAQAWVTANTLPQGIEKAILFLSLAAAKAKAGDSAQAEEALDLAVKASRSVEDARRPFLMLVAAAELADLHSPAAQFVLPQAIKDLNSFEEPSYASLDWTQTLQAGGLQAKFSLEVSNVEFNFSKAFHRAIAADPENGITRAEELKSEDLRAQGFVEVASALLETLPKATQDKPAILVGEDGMRKSATKTVMPAYPQEALKKRLHGVCVSEVQYDGKGDVTKVSILEGPADTIGDSVTQALKQWKFVPSKRMDGTPVNIRGKLTFYFEIDKDGKGRVENPKQFR